MTWNNYHHRGEILRAVIAVADQRRDGLLPMQLDGVVEKFDDEMGLLGALQLRWHTRLAGHIEHQLMDEPMDLEPAVVAAWVAAASELPGVRAILDHYRAEPRDQRMDSALTKAVVKEHLLLAVMAGKGGCSDALAVPAGAVIERRARLAWGDVRREEPRPPRLLDRIRAVLAA